MRNSERLRPVYSGISDQLEYSTETLADSISREIFVLGFLLHTFVGYTHFYHF